MIGYCIDNSLRLKSNSISNGIMEFALKIVTEKEINQLTKQFETMRTQMKSIMSMDEEQMEKVSKGQAPMPQMKAAKPKKGKGKNKGGFRF